WRRLEQWLFRRKQLFGRWRQFRRRRRGREMVMSAAPAEFKVDDARVVAAIVAAEQRTSGEIRVLVSRQKVDEPIAAAQKHFERLGMTNTAARNGVLIFISPAAKTFAVIGDKGVHEKCGDAFWSAVAL